MQSFVLLLKLVEKCLLQLISVNQLHTNQWIKRIMEWMQYGLDGQLSVSTRKIRGQNSDNIEETDGYTIHMIDDWIIDDNYEKHMIYKNLSC